MLVHSDLRWGAWLWLLLSAVTQAAMPSQYDISTVAGSGQSGYAGDGEPASAGQFRSPAAVALDQQGNLYIADKYNHRIRRVGADGVLTTYAGTGEPGYQGDGAAASQARLQAPSGLSLDAQGVLYVADSGNQVIRKIDAQGLISTVAGNGQAGYSGDGGPATQARLKNPEAVVIDAEGRLLIADRDNHRIRRVSSSGQISTLVGNGKAAYSGDGGPATQASLNLPWDLALDQTGMLYIADSGNQVIRRLDGQGTLSTVAGNGQVGYSGDGGKPTLAQFNRPQGVALDAEGNLYIADSYNQRIRRLDSKGQLYTLAGAGFPELGNGGFGGDGGPAATARLFFPQKLAITRSGKIYLADGNNQRIRLLTPNPLAAALLKPVAGVIANPVTNGKHSGDGGPATAAQLSRPSDVAFDAHGNAYVADSGNHCVRKISLDGQISTLIGRGGAMGNSAGAGDPLAARLKQPGSVVVDANGQVYVADSGNHRLLKLDAQGRLLVVAGTGTAGYSGDGGPATTAQLNNPQGLMLDMENRLYLADTGNHRLRRIDAAGQISSLAGTGVAGYSGDNGPALSAQLASPVDVTVNAQGWVYLADRDNYRIRVIDEQGQIRTLAGTGIQAFSSDGGQAARTALYAPAGLALDAAGYLYVSEFYADRIRKIDQLGVISTVAGTGGSGNGGDGGPAQAAQFYGPTGLAVGPGGRSLYIADTYNNRVRRVEPADTQLTLVVIGTGQVQISLSSDTASACERHCQAAYPLGSVVKLSATAGAGQRFSGWEGCLQNPNTSASLLMSQDQWCKAVFVAVAAPTPANNGTPAAPAANLPEKLAATPSGTATTPPAFVDKSPCRGVSAPPLLDLEAAYDQQASLLAAINSVPSFRDNRMAFFQDTRSGYLYSKHNIMRLNLQPISLAAQSHASAQEPIRVDTWQNTWIALATGAELYLQPAVEDRCALQQFFARLGFSQLTVLDNGNLQLRTLGQSAAPWFSLRPDWASTETEEAAQPGFLFSPTLSPGGHLTFSFVFEETSGQRRRQFFLAVPADQTAFDQAVTELRLEPFGPMSFKLAGKSYYGLLQPLVFPGTAKANQRLDVEVSGDLNADGLPDHSLVYPDGSRQWLLTVTTDTPP